MLGALSVALPLVRQFAPALLGNLMSRNREQNDSAAGRIMGVIGELVGITDDPEAAAARFREDAEARARFAERELELMAELDRAFLEDRQDARDRDLAFLAAGKSNTRADVLAYGSIGILALLIVALFVLTIEDDWAKTSLGILIGFVGKIVGDVFAFEFGSSRGSKNKEAQLERLGNG